MRAFASRTDAYNERIDAYKVSLEIALARIVKLESQVENFHDRLDRNSSNSSTPPSANPPNAPKPVVKTPTGKKRGGQPGHQGRHHRRLPKE